MGLRPELTLVATRSHGILVAEAGLTPNEIETYQRTAATSSPHVSLLRFLADPDSPVDIIVDVSSPSRDPGAPSEQYIRAALSGGKHVVTANKGSIAWAGRELTSLANDHGVMLRYEATLMACLPVQILRETVLPITRFHSFLAVPNATTNYLLTELAAGIPFNEALEGARQLGIVEKNPSEDLDGWDSALKATILHNLFFDNVPPLTPADVRRSTFADLEPDWPARAAAADRCVRSVVRGEPGGPVTVGFEEFAEGDLPSLFRGSSMYLELNTDMAGRLCLGLLNPTVAQSAYAVLMDLNAIANWQAESPRNRGMSALRALKRSARLLQRM